MEKFLKEYERIKGKTFYKIKEFPVFETKIEKGGHDHLGLLPDRHVEFLVGYKYEILEFTVNSTNLKELIEGTYYLNREDAEWALLLTPKKKPETKEVSYKRFDDIDWVLNQIQKGKK